MSELRGRALALAALEHIEKHPEEWNQEWFRCRTGCCIAAHSVLLAGGKWEDPNDPTSALVLMPGETVGRSVIYVAEQVLGLPPFELSGGHHPFGAYNTLDDLRRLIDEFLPPEEPRHTECSICRAPIDRPADEVRLCDLHEGAAKAHGQQERNRMQWERDGRP